ncbi:SURF1 family protein [Aureimonas altamirensis]|uniref:SURF1 family protein n=1 Tax=Aureimonas altamirensis TaxID=370622 RepID=UPI002036B3F1|nr:SURF1 family protein [Aureimonas altamirensis]MCM2503119.1 SURF1 family protein [Aureimonas altamirensis]
MTHEPVAEDQQDLRGLTPGRFWSALLLGIVALAILVGLGTWQVERLFWKEALIETIDRRIHGPAEDIRVIVAAEEASGDIDYRPVRVTGTFDHSGERYFLSTREGEAGWNVFTPLIVTGQGLAVFVNRGFVPYALKGPSARPDGQIAGTVTVEGLARNRVVDNPGGVLMPDNDVAQHIFFWRDVPAMTEGLALPDGTRMLPFTIDAGEGAAPGGYPIGGQTVVSMPNNHLEYALTWYGIGLGLAVLLTIMVVAQLRRGRSTRPPVGGRR